MTKVGGGSRITLSPKPETVNRNPLCKNLGGSLGNFLISLHGSYRGTYS